MEKRGENTSFFFTSSKIYSIIEENLNQNYIYFSYIFPIMFDFKE